MNNANIIVADRTKARVYNKSPFSLLDTLSNPIGREKNRALQTDKPGLSRSKFCQPSSTHSLTGEKSPHEYAAIEFGRHLAHYLEKKIKAGTFKNVVIICEPKMMGRIRGFLPKTSLKNCSWVKKDLCHLSDQEIRKAVDSWTFHESNGLLNSIETGRYV